MDWLLPIAGAAGLFAVRDSLGLAEFRNRGLRLAHATALLAAGAVLGVVAERLSESDARALVEAPSTWGPALAMHGLLWVAFEQARRSGWNRSWAGWLFLLPPPLLLYAVGGAIWQALRWSNLPGALTGISIMAAYCGVVLACAFAVGRRASRDTRRGFVLEFSAVSNVSGLILALLPHAEQGEQVLMEQVDWVESLGVLGVVASMIGISFFVARNRTLY